MYHQQLMAYRRIFRQRQCHRCHQHRSHRQHRNPHRNRLHRNHLKSMMSQWSSKCQFNQISSIHIVEQVTISLLTGYHFVGWFKNLMQFVLIVVFIWTGGAAESADLYRNNVSGSNYAMPSHPSNLVNGHHHDMQINNFGAQSAISNGYGMNLKQEPDVNFWLESMSLCDTSAYNR